MASLEHRLEGSPEGTSGGISYAFPLYLIVLFFCISFIFYGFIKANYGGYTQAVLFFKYRQCLITAPGVRTRIYAFGAPASCLRVWCTNHCLRVGAPTTCLQGTD